LLLVQILCLCAAGVMGKVECKWRHTGYGGKVAAWMWHSLTSAASDLGQISDQCMRELPCGLFVMPAFEKLGNGRAFKAQTAGSCVPIFTRAPQNEEFFHILI
jgi:hypothetical protein